MKINFDKYHGCGNDFIIINNLSNTFPKDSENQIKKICNRRFGIGADGLILINYNDKFPFEMIYYNSDGKISTMCGNGGRCVMHYCYSYDIIDNKSEFLACDGIHHGIINDDYVKVSMSDVNGYEKYNDYLFLNTGSPHLVKFVDDVSSLDLINISRNIQKSNRFDNGVNVNLVSRKNDNLYQIRTYERGVEDETLSCGTGAVASALALNILSLINSKTVNLDTKGGLLTVDFNKSNSKYTDIHLSGKVKKVFTGILEL